MSRYETFADMTNSLQCFIKEVYNGKRIHSALGWLSPNKYESQLIQQVAHF
ncbi:MAG: IS3 family transposase [Gallionellaceae bacterium]